jgi:AraC family transcriptional regulator
VRKAVPKDRSLVRSSDELLASARPGLHMSNATPLPRIGSDSPTMRPDLPRLEPSLPSVSLPSVQVIRRGRPTPFLDVRPAFSSGDVRWRNAVLEDYVVPGCVISRHEHPKVFVHVILSGSVGYQVTTGNRTRRFSAVPGTTFVLPAGTIDEVIWEGETHRLAMSIQPELLAAATAEIRRETDLELTTHWDLIDPRIQALLEAMALDLREGSPVGALYGEFLINALAVYLVGRYGARPATPIVYSGGLSARCLRQVLDYIGDNLTEDLSLAKLASLAGMSPHYFAELFKRSTGCPPHRFVLSQRIDRAKARLRGAKHSVIDAALDAGFQDPSHFARTFRRLVGVTPGQFRRSS